MEHARAGIPQMSERVEDCLNVAEAFRLQQRLPRKGFFCDVSQGVQFQKWGHVGTMTTSSQIFDFGRNRFLGAEDYMAALGYPSKNRDHLFVDQAEVCNLTGQGISLPMAATLLMAFIAIPQAPWWHSESTVHSRGTSADQSSMVEKVAVGSPLEAQRTDVSRPPVGWRGQSGGAAQRDIVNEISVAGFASLEGEGWQARSSGDGEVHDDLDTPAKSHAPGRQRLGERHPQCGSSMGDVGKRQRLA